MMTWPTTTGAGLMRALLICAWLCAGLVTAQLGASTSARAQQPSEELKSLREFASDFYLAGAFRQSLEFGEQALALAIKEFGPDHEQIAIATYSLGLTAEGAGFDKKAAEYFRQSVKVREVVYGKEGPGVAEALDHYGQVLMRLGRLDEAEPAFRRALKIRKDLLGMEHAYQATSTANLGAVAVARGKYAEGLQYYRKAISLLASQKTDFVYAQKVLDRGLKRQRSVFIGLSQAIWNGGAQAGLNKEAAFEESFRASQDAWRTSAAEAIARMSARLGTANTPLGRDVSRLQKLADEIVALNEQDMRALTEWSKVQRADPAYSAAMAEVRAASAKRFKTSMPSYKRQRELGKEMTELVKRCPPGQKKGGCEGSLKRIKELGAELSRLSKASSSGNAESLAAINKLNAAEKNLPGYAAFNTARRERVNRSTKLGFIRRDLKKKIIKAYPAYAAMADPQPLDSAQTAALLSDDEALVTMLVGRSKSFVWVVTREAANWVELDVGEKQLAKEVAEIRRGLDPLAAEDHPEGATEFDFARSHILYRLVFGSAEKFFAGKRHLILVPNGPLTSLPPQVLITAKPGTYSSVEEGVKQAQWLLRRHAISVLPSVQSLASLRRLQRTAKSRKPFIGIGDPVLKGVGGASGGNARGAKKRSRKLAQYYTRGLANVRAVRALTPLPDTADELRTIAGVLGAPADDVLLQDAASETSLKAQDLNSYRIVHFATHGLVAGDLSGLTEPALVLTPPDKPTETDDGLLTASEIATLSLDADWVVLSACNTAAGDAIGAEALSGLARAFFFSGARALLVSHWAVYSDAAVKLTTETFSTLGAEPKVGRAEAFRRSMLKLVEQGRPPAYWAPFVIVGEGGAVR